MPRPRRSTAARPRTGRRLPGEGDTIWMGAADSSGLVVSYIQSLYWEFGSGLRAAAHRRADAEPRRELLAREGRREPAAARPQAVPHAQSGARGAARRPRHGLRHHGRRRPAADAGGAVHAPRALSPAAGGSRRPAALAARPHLGLAAHEPAARVALRRRADRPAVIRRSRRRGIAATPIPTPWATPARWCCIRTARSKACTTRAPMAARRASSCYQRA